MAVSGSERRVENAEASPTSASLTDLLMVDHRRLDAIWAETRQALRAGDVPGAAARFAEFCSGLERHIAAEEEILFPVFESLTGMTGGGPTHVMRMEHRELRQLMAEITAGLARGGEDGCATQHAALTARIYAHNGKEERILYPSIERVASDAGAGEDLLRRVQQAL